MTTQELIDLFRGLSADNEYKFLYSDETLVRLAAEAEKEAAVRARLLVDSITPDLCVYDIAKDTQYRSLDPRIVFVRRVKLGSKEIPLTKIHRKDLDLYAPGWEDMPADDTTSYCLNYQSGRIYFHSRLPADDTIRLTVVREPLAPLALSGPAINPEIPAYYHEKLVYWMFWRALSTRDVEEKYDPIVAKENYNQFELVFGPPLRAIDRKWFQDEHGYDDYEGLL